MLRVLSPVMTLNSELFPRDTNKSTFQKGMLSSFCNIIWKHGVFFGGNLDSEMVTPGCNCSIVNVNKQIAFESELLAVILLAPREHRSVPCVHWSWATWSSRVAAGQAPGTAYHVLVSSVMRHESEERVAKQW